MAIGGAEPPPHIGRHSRSVQQIHLLNLVASQGKNKEGKRQKEKLSTSNFAFYLLPFYFIYSGPYGKAASGCTSVDNLTAL